jgi:hypothetical protein
LRVKRSRKSAAAGLDDEDLPHEGQAESVDPSGAALPRLAPAPTQESLTHSFRVQTGSGGSADQTPAAVDGAEGHETGTTPMDMDKEEVKQEPKIEQA